MTAQQAVEGNNFVQLPLLQDI